MHNVKYNPPLSITRICIINGITWKTHGGFRLTSPVHFIRSFYLAIQKYKDEGGVNERFKRKSFKQIISFRHNSSFEDLIEKIKDKWDSGLVNKLLSIFC